jgi:hypothetical protein
MRQNLLSTVMYTRRVCLQNCSYFWRIIRGSCCTQPVRLLPTGQCQFLLQGRMAAGALRWHYAADSSEHCDVY